ncbi:MAG: PaeR7I family type II restriction endonuclease [Acidimicrobiales bacterium]
MLELKSQVGSFGYNQNNRTEEIIGQGRDIQLAARRELLGRLPPWFRYLMIVEDL